MKIRLLLLIALLGNISCKRDKDDKVVLIKYFPDGQIKEKIECNRDSIPNGSWKIYYPSGKIDYDFSYENGTMKGIGKTYFESGNLEEVGSFADGKRIGQHTYYFDLKNKIQAQVEYVLVKGTEHRNTIIEYDTIGNIVKKSPNIILTTVNDSLSVELKDNEFEFMTVVIGEYDSLYNLVGKQSLDTIETKKFIAKIPLAKYATRNVIRGFVENYKWIKFEPKRGLAKSRITYFEYRRH